jgi:hypothetical protein
MQFSKLVGINAVILLWLIYVDCQSEVTYRVPVYVENARDGRIRTCIYT